MEGSRVNGHLEAGRCLHEAKKMYQVRFCCDWERRFHLGGAGLYPKIVGGCQCTFCAGAAACQKGQDGNLVGIWGAMSDFSRSYRPWEENFSKGLYLAGVECLDEVQAPEGWTKWNIPGYEYLCAKVETENTFSEVLDYMQKNQIPLVGAIQDFSCPKSGKDYMLFPIRRL